jgi:hypothetical protein
MLLGCGRIHFDPVGVTWDAAAQPSPLEDLQSGELVIGAGNLTASVPLALPIDRTILFTTLREAEPSPLYGNTMCELASDGITCQRLTMGTDYAASDGTIHVRWTAATFARGVSVQRGVADLTVTTPATVALTSIDPAESFVLLGGGYMNNGTGWGTDEFMCGRIVDAQTAEIRAFATGGVAAWQVVSMTGAQVQRGIASLAMTDLEASVPIAAVDPARSVVLASYPFDSTSIGAANISMVSATIDTSSTLRIAHASAGVPIDLRWEVITLPFAVDHGVTDLAVGVATATAPTAASPATSVALTASQSVLGQSGGSTTLSSATFDDLVGEATATLTPTASGVVVERASTLSSASFSWSAIDFATGP